MSASSTVSTVQTATASLALPEPLQLGAMTVTRREYAAVQIESADGFVGKAYALSREAPMAEIVERMISPHVLGQESDDPRQVWDHAFRGSAIAGRVGLVRRALGLVDVAMWDIAGQRAGRPLWDMFGTGNSPRPAILVASYPTPGRRASDIVAEVVDQAHEGWPFIKISRSPDNDLMRKLLSALRSELPATTGLIVDVGFGWRNAEEALADIREWGEIDLAWLEDPLLPEDIAGCATLRKESGLTIGVGDEVADPTVLRGLVEGEAVDVMRLDVIAAGGFTAACALVDWAAANGTNVSSHIYPEISAHLGTMVETFKRGPGGNPYDPSPTLIQGGPSFAAGMATPPSSPGIGFTFVPGFFNFERTES